MASEKQSVKRKRGRPSKKNGFEKPMSDLIVDAARLVCCEVGVHGLTVERILRTAGISRPTFYKFFKNKDEVLDLIQQRVNQTLINSISLVFTDMLPDEVSLESAVDAYLKWGMEEGAIVGKLYQAMGEPGLLTENRETTVHMVIDVFQRALVAAGRTEQDPLLLEVMIHSCEYLCNPLFTKEHSDEYYNRVRGIVINSFKKLVLLD